MADTTQKSEDIIYCPGCGEMVKTYKVERDDVTEVRCSFCGLTLQSSRFKKEIKEKECIMVVDDSELVREMLKDAFLENNVAKCIQTCVDGADFITKITELFDQKKPVSLVMLDIQMPIMSGINAAVAMRAIETGFGHGDKNIPIIFFSVKKCDENLKKVMEHCKPAQYINKGVNDSPKEMFDRVKHVIAQFTQ